ncbi:MAG: hypothetical protein GY756_28090 [bacterium]|nr:hypothetical protein [bacterium]
MKIKNVVQLLLIVLSFAFFGCENALNSSLTETDNGTERSTISTEEADLYNLGRGYNSSTHENIGRAFDWSPGKTQASDATDSTCGPRTYSFIARSSKDVRELTSSDFDMGVGVSYGPLDVEGTFSKEMFNSLEFSSNSLTMIVRCDYVKKIISLDSLYFKQEALDRFKDGREEFRAYYGDRYLQEVRIGGVLNFICKLETSSSSSVSKDKMEAALNVSYDSVFKGVDLDVLYKRYNITESEYNSMSIRIFTFHNGTNVKSFVSTYAEFKEISEKFDNDMNSGKHVIRTKKFAKYPFFDQPNADYYSYMNLWMDYRDFVRDAGNLANRRIDAEIDTDDDRDMAFDCLILLPEINKNINSFDYANGKGVSLEYSEKVRKFYEYGKTVFDPDPDPDPVDKDKLATPLITINNSAKNYNRTFTVNSEFWKTETTSPSFTISKTEDSYTTLQYSYDNINWHDITSGTVIYPSESQCLGLLGGNSTNKPPHTSAVLNIYARTKTLDNHPSDVEIKAGSIAFTIKEHGEIASTPNITVRNSAKRYTQGYNRGREVWMTETTSPSFTISKTDNSDTTLQYSYNNINWVDITSGTVIYPSESQCYGLLGGSLDSKPTRSSAVLKIYARTKTKNNHTSDVVIKTGSITFRITDHEYLEIPDRSDR